MEAKASNVRCVQTPALSATEAHDEENGNELTESCQHRSDNSSGGDGGAVDTRASGRLRMPAPELADEDERARMERAPRTAKPLRCQVDGCGVDLSASRKYFQRYRVCERHLKAPSLQMDGRLVRFCDQCSRFHGIERFEGARRTCNEKLERTRQARCDKRRQMSSEFEQALAPNHQKKQKTGKTRAQGTAGAALPAAGDEWWEGSSAFRPTAEGLIPPMIGYGGGLGGGYGGGALAVGLGGPHAPALGDTGLAAAGVAANPAGVSLAAGRAAPLVLGGLTPPSGVTGLGGGLAVSGGSFGGLGLGKENLGVGVGLELDTWITGLSRKRAAPGRASVCSVGGEAEAELAAAGDGGDGGIRGGEGTSEGDMPYSLSRRCDGGDGGGVVRRAYGMQRSETAELALQAEPTPSHAHKRSRAGTWATDSRAPDGLHLDPAAVLMEALHATAGCKAAPAGASGRGSGAATGLQLMLGAQADAGAGARLGLGLELELGDQVAGRPVLGSGCHEALEASGAAAGARGGDVRVRNPTSGSRQAAGAAAAAEGDAEAVVVLAAGREGSGPTVGLPAPARDPPPPLPLLPHQRTQQQQQLMFRPLDQTGAEAACEAATSRPGSTHDPSGTLSPTLPRQPPPLRPCQPQLRTSALPLLVSSQGPGGSSVLAPSLPPELEQLLVPPQVAQLCTGLGMLQEMLGAVAAEGHVGKQAASGLAEWLARQLLDCVRLEGSGARAEGQGLEHGGSRGAAAAAAGGGEKDGGGCRGVSADVVSTAKMQLLEQLVSLLQQQEQQQQQRQLGFLGGNRRGGFQGEAPAGDDEAPADAAAERAEQLRQLLLNMQQQQGRGHKDHVQQQQQQQQQHGDDEGWWQRAGQGAVAGSLQPHWAIIAEPQGAGGCRGVPPSPRSTLEMRQPQLQQQWHHIALGAGPEERQHALSVKLERFEEGRAERQQQQLLTGVAGLRREQSGRWGAPAATAVGGRSPCSETPGMPAPAVGCASRTGSGQQLEQRQVQQQQEGLIRYGEEEEACMRRQQLVAMLDGGLQGAGGRGLWGQHQGRELLARRGDAGPCPGPGWDLPQAGRRQQRQQQPEQGQQATRAGAGARREGLVLDLGSGLGGGGEYRSSWSGRGNLRLGGELEEQVPAPAPGPGPAGGRMQQQQQRGMAGEPLVGGVVINQRLLQQLGLGLRGVAGGGGGGGGGAGDGGGVAATTEQGAQQQQWDLQAQGALDGQGGQGQQLQQQQFLLQQLRQLGYDV